MVVYLPHRRKHHLPAGGPSTYITSIINELEFDTINATHVSVALLSTTLAVVAYRGGPAGDDLMITTLRIDDYNYNLYVVDTINDWSDVTYVSVAALDATHFAVSFEDSNPDGIVRTYSCDADGDNISRKDTYTFDALSGDYSDICMMDSTHFVVAYSDSSSDGWVKSFSVDGSFYITEEDSLEYNTDVGKFGSLVKFSATVFFICYQGPELDAHISSYVVDGGWNITKVDEIEFAATDFLSPKTIAVDGTHIALAHGETAALGYAVTFSCTAGGDSITYKDLDNHEVGAYDYSAGCKIDGTHFMIGYQGSGSDGFVKTFSVDGSWLITQVHSLEFDTTFASYCDLVQIDSTHYLLVYTDTDGDGQAKSLLLS
jgi:hypothetical protein